MRDKSDKYFAFFRELIDGTCSVLPKIEPPKKAKKVAANDPRAAQKAMMAEMAKKQAEMAAKKKWWNSFFWDPIFDLTNLFRKLDI